MLATAYNFWSEWEADEKVSFDGINRIINVYDHVTTLDIRADVWSAAVRWLAIQQRGNDRFYEPMERTGLDPIPNGETGDSYFLFNGWKLIIDFSKVKVTGVLFSRDFDSAYYTKDLTIQYAAQVSSIVNTVTIESNTGGLTEEQNARLMSLTNADFTTTNSKIDDVKTDTEQIITDMPTGDIGTDVNIVSVAGSAVESINDFKADSLDMTETNTLIVDSKNEVIATVEAGEDNIIAKVEDIQNGDLEIVNNQMIMKSAEGVEIARFNLFDAAGNRTMRDIYKRERV